MKITVKQLKEMIKQEFENVLLEGKKEETCPECKKAKGKCECPKKEEKLEEVQEEELSEEKAEEKSEEKCAKECGEDADCWSKCMGVDDISIEEQIVAKVLEALQ